MPQSSIDLSPSTGPFSPLFASKPASSPAAAQSSSPFDELFQKSLNSTAAQRSSEKTVEQPVPAADLSDDSAKNLAEESDLEASADDDSLAESQNTPVSEDSKAASEESPDSEEGSDEADEVEISAAAAAHAASEAAVEEATDDSEKESDAEAAEVAVEAAVVNAPAVDPKRTESAEKQSEANQQAAKTESGKYSGKQQPQTAQHPADELEEQTNSEKSPREAVGKLTTETTATQESDDQSGDSQRESQRRTPRSSMKEPAVLAKTSTAVPGNQDLPLDAAQKALTKELAAIDPADSLAKQHAGRAETSETTNTRSLTAPRALQPGAPAEDASQSPTVDRTRFVQRVSGAIRAAQLRDGRIQVRLSPPDLGQLRIELTIHQGALTAKLETETAAARNLLLDNLPALRERLAEQEIRVEKFDVDVRDEQQGSPQQEFAQDRRPRQSGSRETATPTRLPRRNDSEASDSQIATAPQTTADGRIDIRV